MLRFACPACGIGIRVPPERAGTTIRCGKCDRRLRIPVAAPALDQAIRKALPIAPPATVPAPVSGEPAHASHPHEAHGATRATAAPRTSSIQVDAPPDRLEPYWYGIIWSAILVPMVGSWVIVILSSALYYAWRGRYPVRARTINLHGWLAFGAGHLLAGLVFLVFRSTGEPAVDLRGPPQRIGTILRTESSMKMVNGTVTLTAEGKEVDGKASLSGTQIEETRVLALQDGRPTRISKTSLSDRITRQFIIDDKEHADTLPGPLENETILLEHRGGTWVKNLEGKLPTPQQGRLLAEMPAPDADTLEYPIEPVRPGHTWTTKGAALRRILGPGFLHVEGECSNTFERIETFQGEPCAVIATGLQIKGKLLNDEGEEVLVEMGGTGRTYRSLRSGVDLQSTGQGQWQLQGTWTEDGVPVQVRIRGPFALEVKAWLR